MFCVFNAVPGSIIKSQTHRNSTLRIEIEIEFLIGVHPIVTFVKEENQFINC